MKEVKIWVLFHWEGLGHSFARWLGCVRAISLNVARKSRASSNWSIALWLLLAVLIGFFQSAPAWTVISLASRCNDVLMLFAHFLFSIERNCRFNSRHLLFSWVLCDLLIAVCLSNSCNIALPINQTLRNWHFVVKILIKALKESVLKREKQ